MRAISQCLTQIDEFALVSFSSLNCIHVDEFMRISLANISVERQSLDFKPEYRDRNIFQGIKCVTV